VSTERLPVTRHSCDCLTVSPPTPRGRRGLDTVRDLPPRRRHPLRSQPVDNPVYKVRLHLGRNQGTTASTTRPGCGWRGTVALAVPVVPKWRDLSAGAVHSGAGRRHAARPAVTAVVHSVHTPYDYNDRCCYGWATQSLHARPACGRRSSVGQVAPSSAQLPGSDEPGALAALGHRPTPVRLRAGRGCDKVRPCPTGVPSVRTWVARGSMSRAYVGAAHLGEHPFVSRTTPARPDRSDPT
jgi:hypothetical protein